ncbi:MAG: NAD(P)-dependent oxidoreductase [Lysinibacillus sp.]
MEKKIAFIGTGVMGSCIVKHLLAAGHSVTVFTRTKSKAEPLIAFGARWASSVKDAVAGQEIVFTMVGLPNDVREIYYGQDGILQNVKEGAIVIDMTTSQPALAAELYKQAKLCKVSSLDAPVSGGDIGAQNGTLSIMVGGDQKVFEEMLPIFSSFGTQIVHQGDAGSGQHAKMCNQIVAVNNLIGVCEALSYAKKSGLHAELVLDSIITGAAGSWALSNLGPKILKKDYAPGFYIKHMLKDLHIALKEAEKMELQLPGLQNAVEMFTELQQQGYETEGTQALIRWYEQVE